MNEEKFFLFHFYNFYFLSLFQEFKQNSFIIASMLFYLNLFQIINKNLPKIKQKTTPSPF